MFVSGLLVLVDEHIRNAVLDLEPASTNRTDQLASVDFDGLLVDGTNQNRKELWTDRNLRGAHGHCSELTTGDPAAMTATGLAGTGDATPSVASSSRARSATNVSGP